MEESRGVSRQRNSLWVLGGRFVSMHVVPRYDKVAKEVGPKRAKLAKAEKTAGNHVPPLLESS